MKTLTKYLFISITVLFIHSEVRAQSDWNFGLNGGLNLAWVSASVVTGDPLPGDFGKRLSYNVGLFAEYGFNERLYFQIGLNLDQRGFKYKESNPDKFVDITIKASYLEVPLLFRYAFIMDESFKIYILAGPSFAYLAGGRIKGEKTYKGVSYDINDKITDSYNSTDLGIKVGIGAEIPFADDMGATFFDVRYYYGFTDNIRQSGYYETSNVDANSQVLSFVVGVRGYLE